MHAISKRGKRNNEKEEIILESNRFFVLFLILVFFLTVSLLRWTVKNATNNETKTKQALIKNVEVLSFHRNKIPASFSAVHWAATSTETSNETSTDALQ